MNAPIDVTIEPTPNPKARKFIVNRPIHEGPPVTYSAADGDRGAGPMIAAILAVEHVTNIYLIGTLITVTQDGAGSWFNMEQKIEQHIRNLFFLHDTDYLPPPEEPELETTPLPPIVDSPQLDTIRAIIDRDVAPYIASHGGELVPIEYKPETRRLSVFFRGACEGCPSSLGMTLHAVQSHLRDQYDPSLVVTVANPPTELW